MSEKDVTTLALTVYERLLGYYGEPALKVQKPPLDELIQTILSQNTSDANSDRAYASLRRAYPTWESVRAADTKALAEAIRVGGLGRIKAPRIQQIIAHLEQERGSATLDFLDEMPLDEARAYLLSLPGVGPKTAACVLLFSLHKPALPVDTHVYRVSQRLGLIGEKVNAEQAHTLLETLIPPELYYPFHLLLIQHGRTLCSAQRPQCGACPLADLCPFLASLRPEDDYSAN
ncbi:MAG: endonuclease III [Anaerolineae bacterium]